MHDERYPVGKFIIPKNIDTRQVNKWITGIVQLPNQLELVLQDISAKQLDTPYRENGWTARQVVHHLADSHLNSYIRFKWALTEPEPVIKAYDEQKWAEELDAKEMDIRPSLELIKSLHQRWSHMLSGLSKKQLTRGFIHPSNNIRWVLNWTVGMYAWHGVHHLEHVKLSKKKSQ